MTNIPNLKLNDGNSMPAVGLGLWRVGDDEACAIVKEAVTAGYRLLDTATLYQNETGVGRGVAEASVRREELFITTKLWNNRHGYDQTLFAFDNSMKRLGLDYIDLYLIHWPVAGSEKYLDSWKAFIALKAEGRIRSIGVSNFLPRHIERLVAETGVTPTVNQIEYHPFFRQAEVARFDAAMGVVTECWAPLGRRGPLEHPAIAAIAAKHGKTPAQVVLRWHLDEGRAIIPKSSNPQRMRENLALFDFRLDADDLAAIGAIDTVQRIGGDPETFTGEDRVAD